MILTHNSPFNFPPGKILISFSVRFEVRHDVPPGLAATAPRNPHARARGPQRARGEAGGAGQPPVRPAAAGRATANREGRQFQARVQGACSPCASYRGTSTLRRRREARTCMGVVCRGNYSPTSGELPASFHRSAASDQSLRGPQTTYATRNRWTRYAGTGRRPS